MFALVCHLYHVRNDQLRHDLKDHVTRQLFGCTALGNEAEGMRQQLDQALTWFDSHCLELDLFIILPRLLDSFIIGLGLSEVQRKPVRKSLVRD